MPRSASKLAWIALLAILSEAAAAPTPRGPLAAGPAEALSPERWLVLPAVGDYRRAPLHVDPVEASVARGDGSAPEVGATVLKAGGGEAAWRVDGSSRRADLAGGYAYGEFHSPTDGVMLVEAPGAAAICLNGDWVPGDPYRYGWFRPPVRVREGANTLLVHLADPAARPRLVRPASRYAWVEAAAVLPDLVEGSPGSLTGSAPLVNATDKPLQGARLRVGWGGAEPAVTPLRTIAARLVTPVRFAVPAPPAGNDAPELVVELLPAADDAPPLASMRARLRTVAPDASRTNTFISRIDGSVQSYRVLPDPEQGESPGLLVVLHDAGESAEAGLAPYEPIPGAHALAPSGRGRWAFDWEDWSRQDAIEAIEDFQERCAARKRAIDPRRLAVVGRGMGGHGALRLASLDPARFAAAGVTDGWISFYTQGGALAAPADASPIARVLARQAAANDPLRVLENLAGVGVSLLHTGRSRVAVEESRYLRERLGEFHDDFAYREARRDDPLEPMLREQSAWLLARRRPAGDGTDRVEFATPDVGKLASVDWVTILRAERQGAVSSVRLERDPTRRQVFGVTENVRWLRVSLADWVPSGGGSGPVRLRIDGGPWIEFTPGRDGDAIALARDEQGDWRRVPDIGGTSLQAAGLFKGPARPGGVKAAFGSRPVLVVGTRGSEEERRWADTKARYDAHLFLYRGAGLLEVATDAEFNAAPDDAGPDGLTAPDRTLVLYGNRATNGAWNELRREAFARRRRFLRAPAGSVWVGERPESGDDLALLAVRPRVGSDRASVVVIGGSGPVGMRMTTRLRYFWSGVAYPDVLIYGPAAIDARPPGAPPDSDVRAAGYFDSDWGLDGGSVLWRDLAI